MQPSKAELIAVRTVVWASLFPYITLLPFLRIDTQPWALMASLVALLVAWPNIRLLPIHFATFTLALAALFLLLLDARGLGPVRTVAGYVSLFVVAVVATHAFRVDRAYTLRAIDIALIVWLAAGLIQRLIMRDAFNGIVSAARTTELRGVIGLAPEPTYYASTIMLIILWRALVDVRPWHIFLLLGVTFGLASSAQVALITAAATGAFIVVSSARADRILPAIAIALVGVGTLSAIAFYLPQSRLGAVVALIFENPQLLLADHSANERAVHIFAGLYSIKANMFLPNGIDAEVWLKYVNDIILAFPKTFWVPQFSDRILSGLGSIIFQMGFISLVLFAAIGGAWFRWRSTTRYKLIWIVAFGLLFLTAMPLGHPLLGAVLGGLGYAGIREAAFKRRSPATSTS